jgi:hypothetical protein
MRKTKVRDRGCGNVYMRREKGNKREGAGRHEETPLLRVIDVRGGLIFGCSHLEVLVLVGGRTARTLTGGGAVVPERLQVLVVAPKVVYPAVSASRTRSLALAEKLVLLQLGMGFEVEAGNGGEREGRWHHQFSKRRERTVRE